MVYVPNLTRLSSEEEVALNRLYTKIGTRRQTNLLKQAYYEGEQRVKSLNIAMPPKVERQLNTVVGWAGTAVDVIEERLDWQGWTQTGTDFGLNEIADRNDLDVDAGMAHLDALIYGCSFVCAGTGIEGEDEPDQLVTIESPLYMTGELDPRSRRLSAAASRFWDPEKEAYTGAVLYLRDQTIRLYRNGEGERWRVKHRDVHKLGRVPVVRMVNRPRASRVWGRSEISRAVRGYTDAAVRTLMGMEVNREFYSTPQRYAINISDQQFTKADGSPITGFEAIMGRMLGIPFDEENPEARPTVGQFPQSQPGPYLEQVRGLGQMLATEVGVPTTYLGFAGDQAASADAIRAMESRLVKRSERRQLTFGKGWLELGRICLKMRDKKIPDDFDTSVYSKWRDAATPTRSAAADEATKLVQAGVLPADSTVTYDRIGLTPMEQRQVEADKRKERVRVMRDNRVAEAQQARQEDPEMAAVADKNRGVTQATSRPTDAPVKDTKRDGQAA